MDEFTQYTNYHLSKDDDNLIWLTIDVHDKSANVLSKDVLLELDQIIDELESANPRGLIIQSGKKNGFIAGADITAFTEIDSKEDALELITNGQKIFSKIEQLLAKVKGIKLVEPEYSDECCGFGGTFSINEEAVSSKMGLDRIADHQQSGAEFITGVDMSCLMHLEGLIKRYEKPIQVKHFAEILGEGLI